MLELNWTILTIAVVLCSAFVVSLLSNLFLFAATAFLGWFSYNSKNEIVNLQEENSTIQTYNNIGNNVDQVLESLMDLGTKLEQVNDMPIFTDEPIVVELIEEIDTTLRDIERLLIDKELVDFLESREGSNA